MSRLEFKNIENQFELNFYVENNNLTSDTRNQDFANILRKIADLVEDGFNSGNITNSIDSVIGEWTILSSNVKVYDVIWENLSSNTLFPLTMEIDYSEDQNNISHSGFRYEAGIV